MFRRRNTKCFSDSNESTDKSGAVLSDMNPQQIAGIVRGTQLQAQKIEAKRLYDLNPKLCKHCLRPLSYEDKLAKKVFCDSRCSALFTNIRIETKAISCNRCGCPVHLKRSKHGGFCRRKFCDKCKNLREDRFASKTKAEVFKNRSWTASRALISAHAKKVFAKSKLPRICAICGYHIHIEICHRKAVWTFADETKISVINAITNLAPLCPNHHWEFDHGMIYIPVKPHTGMLYAPCYGSRSLVTRESS